MSNILESVLGMLPGFHKKQNSTSHSSKEIEEQTPATPEVSTTDNASTIDNINNDITDKEGNEIHFNMIETIAENEIFLGNVIHSKDNTSDIVDFHANLNLQNDTLIVLTFCLFIPKQFYKCIAHIMKC